MATSSSAKIDWNRVMEQWNDVMGAVKTAHGFDADATDADLLLTAEKYALREFATRLPWPPRSHIIPARRPLADTTDAVTEPMQAPPPSGTTHQAQAPPPRTATAERPTQTESINNQSINQSINNHVNDDEEDLLLDEAMAALKTMDSPMQRVMRDRQVDTL